MLFRSLKGNWENILSATVTAAVGLTALGAGLTGWLIGRATMVERALMIAAGLVLVYPSLLQDLVGLGLFGVAILIQYRRQILSGNQPLGRGGKQI